MRYEELVKLYFERSAALQGYWTIYLVIAGGLLAFSSMRKDKDLITGVLITVLFCCFAYKNLDAIHDVIDQRGAAVKLIKDTPATPEIAAARQALEPTLVAPDYPGTRNFHIFSDVLVLLALWAMELRRWKLD